MAKAFLNKDGIATKAGDMTVYNFDSATREYLSTTVEFLAVGVGIPANSCTDAPMVAKDGFALCRAASLNAWEYVEDHRGETVYNTETGEPVEITAPGEYAGNVTTLAPSTPFDKWNGSEWVTDLDAQKNGLIIEAKKQKASLLAEAQDTISLWQTKLQLGIISGADKASLIVWLKYIDELNAVDPEDAPDIEWPQKPE